jgi:hypothetical protein
MLGTVGLLLRWLTSLVKLRRRLEAENLVLRHQVNMLRRRASGRLRLSNADRLAFVWLYRLCPSVVDAVAIIQPETLIHWHRRGLKAFWRGGSVPLPGVCGAAWFETRRKEVANRPLIREQASVSRQHVECRDLLRAPWATV